MLKNILKLEGAQLLESTEKKSIKGGIVRWGCCEWAENIDGKDVCVFYSNSLTGCSV